MEQVCHVYHQVQLHTLYAHYRNMSLNSAPYVQYQPNYMYLNDPIQNTLLLFCASVSSFCSLLLCIIVWCCLLLAKLCLLLHTEDAIVKTQGAQGYYSYPQLT